MVGNAYLGRSAIVAASHDYLVDVALGSFLHADGYGKPVLARAQNELAHSLLSALEPAAAVACFDHESFELAEAVEEHLGDFACHAIDFTDVRPTGNAGIVRRRRNRIGIDPEVLYLVAELADPPNEHRMPAIARRYRLQDKLEHRQIADCLAKQRLADLDRYSHAERSQHFPQRRIHVAGLALGTMSP